MGVETLEVDVLVSHVGERTKVDLQLSDVYLFLTGVLTNDHCRLYLLFLSAFSTLLVVLFAELRHTSPITLLPFLYLAPELL